MDEIYQSIPCNSIRLKDSFNKVNNPEQTSETFQQ